MKYKDIYDRLLVGDKLQIRIHSRTDYNNLRVNLQRRHREFYAAGLTGDSLCSDFVDVTATFWLGQPRRRKSADFEIIEHEKQISEPVGDNSQISRASGSSLHGSPSSDTDTSCP